MNLYTMVYQAKHLYEYTIVQMYKYVDISVETLIRCHTQYISYAYTLTRSGNCLHTVYTVHSTYCDL